MEGLNILTQLILSLSSTLPSFVSQGITVLDSVSSVIYDGDYKNIIVTKALCCSY